MFLFLIATPTSTRTTERNDAHIIRQVSRTAHSQWAINTPSHVAEERTTRRKSIVMAQSKSTGKFDRQGHTAGIYGNDPNATPKGQASTKPRDLKP